MSGHTLGESCRTRRNPMWAWGSGLLPAGGLELSGYSACVSTYNAADYFDRWDWIWLVIGIVIGFLAGIVFAVSI